MTISILPALRRSFVSFASFGGTSRESRPSSIGKPWKRSLKFWKCWRAPGRADQLASDFADPLFHPRLAPLPCLAAQPVESDALALASVASEDVDILDRDVELVAAGIFQGDAIVRRFLDRDLGQPVITADPMIGMDDEIARRERGELAHEGFGALLALAPPDETVAEHVLLGQERDFGSAEAVIELDRRQRHLALRRDPERFLPIVDRGRLREAMFGEQPLQPFAGADGIACEHHLALRAAKLGDMGDDRLVNIGVLSPFGSEIPCRIDREIEHSFAVGFVERSDEMERSPLDQRLPFVAVEIERLGRERTIASRLLGLGPLPVVEIIEDRIESRFGGAAVSGIADDEIIVRQMIEQGRQLLFEQGKPVIDSSDPAPVRNRLVDRIAGRGGAEPLAIGGAEALDAVFVEQGFRGRQQSEAFDPVDASLGGGIEAAHAFDLVAEEIQPERFRLARREEIDQAAPDRELSGIANRLGSSISVRLEQSGQPVDSHPLPRGQSGDKLADPERRQGSLEHRVHRRDEKLGPGLLALEGVEGREPLGRRAKRRRASIVGEAVPGGEAQHFELGREIAGRIGKRPHRRFVGRDEDGAALRRAREIGGEPGQEARRDAGQGHRPLRGNDRGKVGQLIPDA